MSSSKRVTFNITVSTIAQIITLALGLILPRIILVSWGSEYNGLINSVTTIMRYMALLEAGVSTSTLQALYKSIGNNDVEKTSVIVRSSQRYYHRVALIYGLLVVVISFVYPLFLKTSIAYWEIVIVILLQGCTGVINFSFRAAYQQLLNAEGKYYIISLLTLCTTVLTYASKIISIIVFNSIIVMQILGVVVMGLQVIAYAVYFHKKYAWLKRNVEVDMSLLENRRYYIVQQIAGLVFNSTDTIVLSVFCGLKVASVYTVYNMVYSALAALIGILRNSTNFVLGQSYHKSISLFERIYGIYTSFQASLGCFLASCSVVLISGFVKLYTSGVEDINYINYAAAILFSISIMLDCARGASLAGANVAGRAPTTTWRYVVEAGINLAVSLFLVNIIGMNGVLIGTVVAGLWRSIDSIYYFNHNILKKSAVKELVLMGLRFAVFAIYAVLGRIVNLTMQSYSQFFLWGILITCSSGVLFGIVFFIENRIHPRAILSYVKHE